MIVSAEYSDYADLFLEASVVELLKYTGINDHHINLVDDKQPFYSPIYSLGPVEFETLKIYIEINLANSFIWPSQSPVDAPILFIKKKNSSFWLCVNYLGLNDLTIKN